MTTPDLDTPLQLPCGVHLPNRLLKSAMTEGLADAADRPTERHVTLYRRWAEGGTGTLLTGNVMVDHRYLERPGNVVVEDDTALDALAAWAQAGTAAGNQLWMQISHPGRQVSRVVSSKPVAPSAVQLQLGGLFARPRALSDDEIEDILGRYARAASIAKRAGFTGVQVHGAHGYLASQFLSPRTNQRTDRWGGSLDNRARFLREAVRRTRAAVGSDFPVAVKLNSSDFQRGAFTPQEACQVAAWLVQDGIDLLEISGGTYEQASLIGIGLAEKTRRREAYFLEYAAQIRAVAKVPLCVTGGFRSRAAMAAALAEGQLDVVGIARPLCVHPDAARGLLDGSLEMLPSDDAELQLAPGVLGPRSRFAMVRALNAQAHTAWYYHRILELADGKAPTTAQGARGALWSHARREAGLARARRRPALAAGR